MVYLPRSLSHHHTVVVEQLESVFSLILEKKTFPSDWKASVIIPVFKKGDQCDSSNYRGMPLMDMATKVIVMILFKRFKEAWDERTCKISTDFEEAEVALTMLFALFSNSGNAITSPF